MHYSMRTVVSVISQQSRFFHIFQELLMEFLPGGRGYCQKHRVGVCGPLPKSLILFKTKICNFPYPNYDLTEKLDSPFMTVTAALLP